MADSYIPGEKKIRPGAHYHIGKKGTGATAGAVNGVTAVLFRADFGPLCTAVEMSSDEDYTDVFGDALTTDAIAQAIAGGAKTIIAVRVGTGGTAATLDLKSSGESPAAAVTLTAKYPGAKPLTCTVRKTLADESIKECIIYSGTKQIEKVEFAAGSGKPDSQRIRQVPAAHRELHRGTVGDHRHHHCHRPHQLVVQQQLHSGGDGGR